MTVSNYAFELAKAKGFTGTFEQFIDKLDGDYFPPLPSDRVLDQTPVNAYLTRPALDLSGAISYDTPTGTIVRGYNRDEFNLSGNSLRAYPFPISPAALGYYPKGDLHISKVGLKTLSGSANFRLGVAYRTNPFYRPEFGVMSPFGNVNHDLGPVTTGGLSTPLTLSINTDFTIPADMLDKVYIVMFAASAGAKLKAIRPLLSATNVATDAPNAYISYAGGGITSHFAPFNNYMGGLTPSLGGTAGGLSPYFFMKATTTEPML